MLHAMRQPKLRKRGRKLNFTSSAIHWQAKSLSCRNDGCWISRMSSLIDFLGCQKITLRNRFSTASTKHWRWLSMDGQSVESVLDVFQRKTSSKSSFAPLKTRSRLRVTGLISWIISKTTASPRKSATSSPTPTRTQSSSSRNKDFQMTLNFLDQSSMASSKTMKGPRWCTVSFTQELFTRNSAALSESRKKLWRNSLLIDNKRFKRLIQVSPASKKASAGRFL